MSLTRTTGVIAASIALVMLCSCATKKYVKQEVATTQAQLSTRIDEEAARRTELANQVGELTALNKKNTARIEQVQGNLDSAVKTIDPKIEDARNAGVAAGKSADAAMNEAKENAAAFANRNNFQVLATQDVYFKVNNADLDDEAKTRLGEVGKVLSGNNNLVVELQGYTDNSGDAAYNLQLSDRRVENVVRYLVGDLKVDLRRIARLGLGEANPADDNKTREGRAKNRRVTVMVLGPK
jgi:outer membrane protein OmpA-like peptidoglycan-associated protein